MLAQERRRRLLGAMADAGIEHIVLYGNAWQGDYLRYAADFGILEGHGIAFVSSDGTTELFLERLGLTSLADLPPLAPLLPDIDAIDEL